MLTIYKAREASVDLDIRGFLQSKLQSKNVVYLQNYHFKKKKGNAKTFCFCHFPNRPFCTMRFVVISKLIFYKCLQNNIYVINSIMIKLLSGVVFLLTHLNDKSIYRD